ncbi:hypothetical protein F5X68DRAFT_211172 [Plectosphaerella plurivora]|uniref:Uncharacterized protein n=1 Tax=Plectosphaerella plurivora TaxID=936078 RepID=A0A9P9AA85_9PEZI|nr:hypothetical protein F5X68DRAFT_211172 [Plectosphaerella plurivora]
MTCRVLATGSRAVSARRIWAFFPLARRLCHAGILLALSEGSCISVAGKCDVEPDASTAEVSFSSHRSKEGRRRTSAMAIGRQRSVASAA